MFIGLRDLRGLWIKRFETLETLEEFGWYDEFESLIGLATLTGL